MGAGSSLPAVDNSAESSHQVSAKVEGPGNAAGDAGTTMNDNMELTRAISHLASANQQLAAAHNLTLGHLHRLLTQQQGSILQPNDVDHKTKKTKAASSNSRVKRRSRIVVSKPSTTTTTTTTNNRISRRLIRVPAFDESRDVVDYRQDDSQTKEEQRLLIERLEDSEKEGRRKDERLDEMSRKLRQSELESARLLAELETFQNERKESEEAKRSVAEDQEDFKRELMLKREMRQRAIAGISAEMERLRCELGAERDAHERTKRLLEDAAKTDDGAERVEALRLSQLLKVSDEITNELWLQLERTDDLRFQLENEPDEHRLRIASLKRLADETRASLRARKQQVNQLKDRLAQLLVRLGDRGFLEESDDIREEAERQIEDIASSRSLGDERSRIMAELKDHCFKQIHELGHKLDASRKDNLSLEEELKKTGEKMNARDADILNLESQLGLAKADCRDLQNQMSLINGLFTQMLLSASSAEMDLDRLTRLLQENHDLISDVAKENGTEAAALPKLLLDIIEQVDGKARDEKREDTQQDSIAHNLPKVWRVLMELISCHASEVVETNAAAAAATTSEQPDSCYKSVDTPTGPRLVISVSKTYIRLKELILEKKHLQKEMNRMKQLNTHLETKLSEQEKRLSTVSDELSKTWNIVGRMQVQHQQLHTHEKILRYELQQKRKMLQELKQELEYCREKWESARQKNNNTEIEWRSLRREFTLRKTASNHQDSFNNSGESGFSDEREGESDSEDEGQRVRPRRRAKKDESRVSSPETEPTDTEVSEERKTESSEPRTPTPESENCCEPSLNVSSPDIPEEPELDPLEKALSACIENIIESTGTRLEEASSSSGDDDAVPNVVSVFSIGPFPTASSSSPMFASLAASEEKSQKEVDEVSQGSSSSLETVKEVARTPAEVLDARAERLRNLEEQAQLLVRRVNATNRRGSALNSRLEELHETYGSTPAAPPMPDVLPAFRLRTQQEDTETR